MPLFRLSIVPLCALLCATAVGRGADLPTPAVPSTAAAAPGQIARWDALNTASQQMLKRGDLIETERLCREAIALASTFPPPDTRRSRSQMQLAEVLRWQKKFDQAEQAFKDAVASCEAAAGPDSLDLVDPLESLANFYTYPTPRPNEIAPLYRRILSIVQRGPAPDDREVARRARNLADVEVQRGRFAEADPLFQTVLAAAEKHEDELPYYLLNAADFYRAWGKYDRAEPLARRLLTLRERGVGPDAQLDIGVALTCLADIHLAAGKPAEAEPLYARALAIVEKVAGPDSPDVAPRLVNLAGALAAQKKYDAAAAQYQRALSLTEKGLGVNVAEVADVLEKYVVTLKAMNQPDQAKAYADRAAAIRNSLKTARAM